MDREEVALRAKIQAMKNVLQVRARPAHLHTTSYTHRAPAASFAKPYAPYYSRKPTLPVNKTWTRTGNSTGTATAAVPVVKSQSANRVWVNANAVRVSPAASAPPARMSFAQRVKNRMQLQVLRLEDGEYAKANGGFTLLRSDALKAKAAEAAKRVPVNAYVAFRRPSVGSAAATRARQVVTRARAVTRTKAKTRVRTEYCRFFNKFGKSTEDPGGGSLGATRTNGYCGCCEGYCNNKNACKFLHDSRRVALCRDFAKGDCKNDKCLLSHDKNKMPVCTLFLRGACTRDDCRFRHVKVSGLAQVCEAFLKGYCPQGAACTMKHELPTAARKKRPLPASASPDGDSASPDGDDGPLSKQPRRQEENDAATGTLPSPGSVESTESVSPDAGVESGNGTTDPQPASSRAGTLSIRPNIRFAPRNTGLMPALLSLRKRATAPQE